MLTSSLYLSRYDYREVFVMSFLWKQKSENENIIIVGCGKFGSALAEMLEAQKKTVSIIDSNETNFKNLPPSFHGITIKGDGADIDLLQFAGAKTADVLVASTNNDNTNIMIAQIAKRLFEISKVIVKLYDTSKQIAYSDMDIMTICPAILSAKEFERVFTDRNQEQYENFNCRRP